MLRVSGHCCFADECSLSLCCFCSVCKDFKAVGESVCVIIVVIMITLICLSHFVLLYIPVHVSDVVILHLWGGDRGGGGDHHLYKVRPVHFVLNFV